MRTAFPLWFPRTALLVALLPCALTSHAAVTVLHEFTGAGTEGATPQGDLLAVNGTLYGMTAEGGLNASGTIYRLSTGGGSFATLMGLAPNSFPSGALAANGSLLLGMTNGGGTGNLGTIFQIGTDGSGYGVLRNFAGGTNDGKSPLGTLLVAGTTVYGMTQRGGGGTDTGVVFRMNLDGSNFSVLHRFTGGATDGSFPLGSLTLSGGVLYGTTSNGGAFGGGTVFRIDTDGGNFGLLHSFAASNPQSSLLAANGALYGTTFSGGTAGKGTVFRIGTDGTAFEVLHDFAGGAGDGSLPSGSLTLAGGNLYGTTQTGGSSDVGTIFRLAVDGSSFSLEHHFNGSDGASPQGTLIAADNALFGTTAGGGSSGAGTVFRLAVVPEPSVVGFLFLGALVGLAGRGFRKRRLGPQSPEV